MERHLCVKSSLTYTNPNWYSSPKREMNATIKQYSGPSSTAKSKGLPKAAKKFAQQMGLDLTGLEAEAEDMWEMLNKMSVDEPAEYENFVDEQMRQQKAEDSVPEDQKPNKGRMFRPKVGFCIKCRTTGNDGIKIRDFGANSGKDLFLNFVSHEAIEPPKDKSGRPVLDDRGASADGLELPLLIGPLRDVDSDTLAVDVVLHPVILARCDTYSLFRTQVIDLALEWTTQEVGVQYGKKYEVVPWNYHGGRGADKSTPVLFPVDEVLDRQAGGAKAGGAGDSLLDTIKVEKQKDTLLEMASSSASSSIDATSSPIIMGKATKDKSKKKSVGIQEMREDGTFEASVAQPEPPQADSKKVAKKKKAAPAVKKGFLNNNSSNRKSLYPEGSSEGQNGGAYTRLMSRCTVVDTANMPQQQQQGGGGGSPPVPPAQVPRTSQQAPPPPVPSQTNPFSDKASSASASVETRQQKQVEEETEEASSSRPALSINEQNEIDKMFSGLDDDFASSLSKDQKSKESDDFMTQQFADFAKALTGPNGPNREKDVGLDNFVKEMTKTPKDEDKDNDESAAATTLTPKVTCKVNNKLPKHITTNVEISNKSGGAQKKELRITVNNVDKSQLKQTDLQVSERKVVIVVPSNDNLNADGVANSGGSVQVVPPFLCNIKTVKAAMSKKKKNIEIIVSEC